MLIENCSAPSASAVNPPGARLRIVLLTTGLALGGAETQVAQLAIGLRRRDWDVHVVSMLAPVAHTAELSRFGIPVFQLGMKRGVADPRAILRLASFLRRNQPDLVHSHMVHANFLARAVRVLYRFPALVCTAHSLEERPDGRDSARFREWIYRITDPLATMTTQVSEVGRSRYIEVAAAPKQKIAAVPNGVDTKRFCRDHQSGMRTRHHLHTGTAFVWLAVGRLEKVKNFPCLLQAFSLCRNLDRQQPTILLISGQGSKEAELKRLTAILGITDCVKFLGPRGDIGDLMNASDAFVLSSEYEGLPMVLLEAGACELPVVASAVGGTPEVVLDGITGVLVQPDNPRSLADAMISVMHLPAQERSRMGAAGRDHVVRNFDIEKILTQWEKLYGTLLSKRRTAQ